MILWWHGDTVEAAGRPSGYWMNYSIRDNIPLLSSLLCFLGVLMNTLQEMGQTWGWEPSLLQGLTGCSCPEGTGQGSSAPASHRNRCMSCALQNRGTFLCKAPRNSGNKCLSSSPKETSARFLNQKLALLLQIHHALSSNGMNNYWWLFTLS